MINFSGNVKTMDAELSGNSEISDYDLRVDLLKINLSGNSNAYLSVSNSISIYVTVNSVLFYLVNAYIAHQKRFSA